VAAVLLTTRYSLRDAKACDNSLVVDDDDDYVMMLIM